MRVSNTAPAHSREAHAFVLRNALSDMGHTLDERASLDVITELNKKSRWIGGFDDADERLKIAESLLDTVIEARQSFNYNKLVQLIEEPYRELWMNERDFRQGLRKFDEDLGDYVTRTYIGSLNVTQHPENIEKFPDAIHHVWRGQFEKANIIIVLSVYRKNGEYFVGDLKFSYR